MSIRNFSMIIVNVICSLFSYLGIFILSQNVFLSSKFRFSELVVCIIVYGISFAITSIFLKNISKKELTINIITLFTYKILILLLALYYEDSVFFFIELFIDTITLYLTEMICSFLNISGYFAGIIAVILSVIYCSGILSAVNKLFSEKSVKGPIRGRFSD